MSETGTSAPVEVKHASLSGSASIKTMMLTDLVDSTKLLDSLGDERAAELFAAHDRLARDLLAAHGGQEIDKTDGFLFLFQRPIAATQYALAYHSALKELGERYGVPLAARAGIHLGEVVLRENSAEDVARGAKPVEVEGLAKHMVARVMSLALGGQTLMSETAFVFAKRAATGNQDIPSETRWERHGLYKLKGVSDPLALGEVGLEGVAPLRAPPDSEKAWRASTTGGIELEQRSGTWAGWIAMVAAALIVGGAAAALFRQGEDGAGSGRPTPAAAAAVQAPAPAPPPAAPPTPAAPTIVALRVESAPPGASIRFRDTDLGRAPIVRTMPAKTAGYPFRATLTGYLAADATCEVSADDVARGESACTLTLAPEAPEAPAAKAAKAASRKGKPSKKRKAARRKDSVRKTKVHMIE